MGPVPKTTSVPSFVSIQLTFSPHVPESLAAKWKVTWDSESELLPVPMDSAFHIPLEPPKYTSFKPVQLRIA